MFEKLEELKARFEEINEKLADNSVISDIASYRELIRERSSLEKIVETFDHYCELKRQLSEAKELLESENEREMIGFLKSEIDMLEEEISKTSDELKELLIPRDEYEGRNAVVEIRAGTGGDEAALFAADLYRMYTRYAEKRNWKVELLSSSPSELGGFKEIIFSLSGTQAYPRMKNESGVHRVQRVPVTESGGRIHTSTATVAVLPEAEEVDVEIDPADIKIDVFRSTGPGGQSVNTTDSAVRITYKPTGMVVTCQDEKSQLQNREKAMRILRTRLLENARLERKRQEDQERRMQVGTGERSEKVRTYNFPQSRVTDHRIGLTLHKLQDIMEGELDEIIDALLAHERAKAIEQVG